MKKKYLQVTKLTDTIQKLQGSSKETRDALATEVCTNLLVAPPGANVVLQLIIFSPGGREA